MAAKLNNVFKYLDKIVAAMAPESTAWWPGKFSWSMQDRVRPKTTVDFTWGKYEVRVWVEYPIDKGAITPVCTHISVNKPGWMAHQAQIIKFNQFRSMTNTGTINPRY